MEPPQLTLSDEQRNGLRILVEALRADDSWIQTLTEALPSDIPTDLENADLDDSLEQQFGELIGAAEQRDMTGYWEAQRQRSKEMAAAGLSLRTIPRSTTAVRGPLVQFVRSRVTGRDDQIAAVDMLDFILMESLVAAGEVYADQRQDDVEDEYRQLVRRLSTPVIEVWDGIQVLPLIGVIDSTRAQQMTEQLLERIVERQARVVILDITGVPTVDTAVGDHLMRTIQAAGLVGTKAILVGISPQVLSDSGPARPVVGGSGNSFGLTVRTGTSPGGPGSHRDEGSFLMADVPVIRLEGFLLVSVQEDLTDAQSFRFWNSSSTNPPPSEEASTEASPGISTPSPARRAQ